MALALVCVCVFLICILLLRDVYALRHARPLENAPHNVTPLDAALVSVIVPARNEEAGIARCLDGLAHQDYPRYEVIIVDDGSTDATPRILAHYAAQYPQRVRVTRGRPLPPGWVGKCNACLHGSTFARGEWLLFLDADTAAQPTLLGAMLRDAQERRLDALSLFPFNELGSLAERIILPVFFQFAWTVFPLAQASTPEGLPQSALANGQCFLFRADVYQAMGGHAVVKDKVLEDVEFARALRRAGYRVGLAAGAPHIRVRMYHNFAEVAQGLAKHAWNGQRAGGWRAYWGILRMMLTLFAPPLLCAAGLIQLTREPVGLLTFAVACAGYTAVLSFWRAVLRDLYALPARYAWLMPLGFLAYLLIAARGTLAVWLKRGVTWKGRSYT
jgi:chlorobactene glucosyltransferase